MEGEEEEAPRYSSRGDAGTASSFRERSRLTGRRHIPSLARRGAETGAGHFSWELPGFFFFLRPCAFFHGVTGGRRRGGAAPACSPYEIAPATRVRGDMGNPIYAVPKSKSEFTHVYIQVRPPRPQPPLGIFPHTGPRSSSSTIAGRRTGRQSRLWTENLTRHETTTATILCARRQNILPDCVSSFSFFLSLATPAA